MYDGVRDFLQNACTYICVCVSVYYTRPCVHRRRGGYTRARRPGPGAADTEQNGGKKKTFLIYSAGRRH